jgi:hypothetical protein
MKPEYEGYLRVRLDYSVVPFDEPKYEGFIR